MLSNPNPDDRYIALDCLFTHDPYSNCLDRVLCETSVSDESSKVRELAITLLCRRFEGTCEIRICKLLANIVENSEETFGCRRSAYFALHEIWETPGFQERNLENLVSNVKSKMSRLKRFLNFNLSTDVDLEFVRSFLN